MGHHEKAITAAITAAGNKLGPTETPLVELAKVLARQMDAAGPDPSTRLTAAYLSCLKDIRRALADTPPTAASTNSRLAQLRANHARRTQPVE